MSEVGEIPLEETPPEEKPTSNEATRPSYAEYRDLFAPDCLQEFKTKLEASNGKAFFVIHPFYLENTWYEKHLTDVVEGRDSDTELVRFIREMGEILPKLVNSGVPIVILQEMKYLGETHLEEEGRIQSQYQELLKYLQEVTNIDSKQIFVIYTQRGGPFPLTAGNEDDVSWDKVIRDRLESLKRVGLKAGLVAGRDFKPSEGDNFEYYASAANKDYGWGKTADKTHGGQLLKDYFDQSRKGSLASHPLQLIRPDQCVGEFMRMLAFNGIRPAITTLTYPDKIMTVSNYKAQEYNGRTVYLPLKRNQK